MIRRISTKLLIAVLAAVVLPFLGFAVFVDSQMAERLSREVVLYSLKSLAADLAGQIDREIEGFQSDVRLTANRDLIVWAVDEPDFRNLASEEFDRVVTAKEAFDLFLLVDEKGHAVASSRVDRTGAELGPDVLDALKQREFTEEPWFIQAFLYGQFTNVDWHRSDLLPQRANNGLRRTQGYHIGFSCPVRSYTDKNQVVGVLYALVDWEVIQDDVNQPVLKDYFQGLVGPDEFSSAYGWIWGADGETIQAHDNVALYGERVSDSPHVGLPALAAAARASDWDLYPEYEFNGRTKNAAFKHTKPPDRGGFGWVVGVGIDNDDIFRAVRELRALLFKATLLVLLVSVLLTMVIARRTTTPILALREHTQRVAAGDLDAQLEVRGHDELAELATAFNQMTTDLKVSREQLVKAEKDAAWREMARQVAHDIKNPLTPIQLSIDLLKRARDDGSAQFDQIFERTVETVRKQVAHLREIAGDFHALTGVGQARPASVELGGLAEEVADLNRAWASERNVQLRCSGPGAVVWADASLLRRMLINLVSNAIEAMPHGGHVEIEVRRSGSRALLEVRDDGVGIPEDVRTRLFEPYFTTRSSGTGLGLAIAKRVVEDAGGTISLVPGPNGVGTVARIELPAVNDPDGAVQD